MNNFNKAGNMGNMGSSDAKANILMGGSASTSFSSAMGLQQQQQTNMPNNQFSQFRGNQNNMMLRSEASMDMGDEMNPYNTNDAFHPSNYSNPAIGASIDAEAGAGVGVGVGGYSSEEPPVSTYVDEYPDLLELPPQPRYDVFCPGYVPCMPPPVSI
jgi:hypothetical protein